MHFFQHSIYYAACRNAFFLSCAPIYISAHAHRAILFGDSSLMPYCSSEEHHSKETHFLLGRGVGLLSVTLSGTPLNLSQSLHTGCQGKPTLFYSFNYLRNVFVHLLCVKSFSLQLSLIFGERAIAICYTKAFVFIVF